MGFRFRKSFKILPGVRWNISRAGTSFSFGGRGLTHTVGTKGARTTVGIPGTGLSYTKVHKQGSTASTGPNDDFVRQKRSDLQRVLWIVGSVVFVTWLAISASRQRPNPSSSRPPSSAVASSTKSITGVTPPSSPAPSVPLRAIPVQPPLASPTISIGSAIVDVPPVAKGRLVFAPAPSAPNGPIDLQHTRRGRYRIRFKKDGAVAKVTIVHDTGISLLDARVVDTLREWKSSPGPEWETVIPITFGQR